MRHTGSPGLHSSSRLRTRFGRAVPNTWNYRPVGPVSTGVGEDIMDILANASTLKESARGALLAVPLATVILPVIATRGLMWLEIRGGGK